MNKENHIELFVIEYVVVEGVHKIFKPLWDDIEKHASLDYGSLSLPLSTEKAND